MQRTTIHNHANHHIVAQFYNKILYHNVGGWLNHGPAQYLHTALVKSVTICLNRNTGNTNDGNRNTKTLKSVHECRYCAGLACNLHTRYFRSISYLALSVQVC